MKVIVGTEISDKKMSTTLLNNFQINYKQIRLKIYVLCSSFIIENIFSSCTWYTISMYTSNKNNCVH